MYVTRDENIKLELDILMEKRILAPQEAWNTSFVKYEPIKKEIIYLNGI